MSVFVDTGVFFAHHDRDTTRHESAANAMRAVATGEFGHPHTSDYVFDETVTLTLARTNSHDAACSVGRRILGRNEFGVSPIEVQRVTAELFDRAVALFERYDDHSLSFTDTTTIALIRQHEIDAVCSFDDDFDGLVERIDPTNV